MATLPLELHHVLEEEYVSMYGPLEKSSTAYAKEHILDERWARTILQECGFPHEGKAVDEVLNAQVGGRNSLEAFERSAALTDAGRALFEDHRQSIDPEVRRRLIDEAMRGTVKPLSEIRLDTVYSAIHARAQAGKERTALCISGGGVRSATFGLGIIQGMASAGLMEKFHYLSTVSGGGYMGSWLSSWVRRHPQGVSGVQNDLQRADTAVGQTEKSNVAGAPRETRKRPDRKIFPEPTPLRHLREYSSYLSPKLSVFSGDTWTMIALYLRNLLLNLLVLVPLLALVLAFPRMFSFVLEWSEKPVLHPAGWAWIGAGLITWAFAYIARKRPVVQGREGKPTTDGWFIMNCILPLVGASTALAVFYARTVQDPTLLRSGPSVIAIGLALAGMSVIPFGIYYFRYFRTTAAERRAAYGDGSARQMLFKIGAELFAASVAMGTTAILLFYATPKVFPNPNQPIPTTATLAPIERALASSAPMASLYLCLSVPLLLLIFFVQGSIFVGLSGKFNEDSDREWWGRAGAWLLLFGLGLAVFNVLAVFGPVAFYYAPYWIAGTGGVAGAIAAGLGFSDKTSAKKQSGKTKSDAAASIGSALTVPIFVAVVLAAISVGTTVMVNAIDKNPAVINPSDPKIRQQATLEAKYSGKEVTPSGETTLSATAARVTVPELQGVAHLQVVQTTSGRQVLLFLGLAAFAVIMSTFIGVNRFSLHAFYRNRMIRGYLGASRHGRDPDAFTGFDEHDDMQMWEMRPELLWTVQIEKPAELVKAMQDPNRTVPNKLWSLLDEKTRKQLTDRVNGVTIESLVLNLNAILLRDDEALATKLNVSEPAWVTVGPTKTPYPLAIRNRATLDAHFSEWITVMVPPADAVGAPYPEVPQDADATEPALLKINGTAAPKPAPPQTRKQARAPLHVLNGALNLTTGENLAWQERRAATFSMSPYHTGSFILGYRSSREYGGSDGISLGTAATISGAAASPNMGYASSPALAFLLTFFNLRLGTWLGNPGPRGGKSYKKTNPRTGLVPLLAELTGNSNAKHPWVNLSDGGHFDNLGLYEMVMRRCHQIVVSDAGSDPNCTFDSLGAAICKIRIDFGIPIDVESVKEMQPRSADKNGKPVKGSYMLTATIRYDAVDENGVPGRLIYIKPGLYDHPYLPVDVYHYAASSPTFPHESTADQFYSESQFESYRALARHAVDVISGTQREPKAGDVRTPIMSLYDSVGDFAKQAASAPPQ